LNPLLKVFFAIVLVGTSVANAADWQPAHDLADLVTLPAGSWNVAADRSGNWIALGCGEEIVYGSAKGKDPAELCRQVASWLESWVPSPAGELEGFEAVETRWWADKVSTVFQRQVDAVPVLGDLVAVTLGHHGKPMALSFRFSPCGEVMTGIFPSYGFSIAAARDYLTAAGIKEEYDRGKVYFPSVTGEIPQLVPAHQVVIRCEEPNGRWLVTVDLMGEVLACEDLVRHGSAAGMMRLHADNDSYCDGPAWVPAADLELVFFPHRLDPG